MWGRGVARDYDQFMILAKIQHGVYNDMGWLVYSMDHAFLVSIPYLSWDAHNGMC
jgi:hypothetical protein